MALQAAIDAAAKRAASGASTKNTVTGLPNTTGGVTFGLPGISSYPAPMQTPKTVNPTVTSSPGTMAKFATPTQSATPYNPSFPDLKLTSAGNPINTPTPSSMPWYDKNTGAANPDFTPTSEKELSDYIQWAKDTGNQENVMKANAASAKYYGLNTTVGGLNFAPGSNQGLADLQNALNQQQTSQLDAQISYAKAKAEQTMKANSSNIQGSIGAVNREGAQSESNQLSGANVISQFQKDLDQYRTSLDNQKLALQQAQAAGNTKLAEQISQNISDTQNAMVARQAQQAQIAQGYINALNANNALVGVSPEQMQAISAETGLSLPVLQALSDSQTRSLGTTMQQQQFDNQIKSLTTFQDLAVSGITITPQLAQQFAQSTGIPSDALLNYNQTAQAILSNKQLDAQTQQVLLNQEKDKLKQMQQGIYTQAAQNTEYLKQMYKDKIDPNIISAFKSAAGITDQTDPVYQAKLQSQLIQNLIDQKHANGEVVTPQDLAAYAQAQETLIDAGLAPGAYVATQPRNKKYKMSYDEATGAISVTGAKPGSYGGQCGEFVNDVLGTSVGDSVQSKLDQTDPSITIPTAGQFFVQKYSKEADPHQYGHIGLVEKVDLPNQRFLTLESNYHGDEKVGERWVNFSAVAGFGNAPKATVIAKGGSDAQIKTVDDYYQQIVDGVDFAGMSSKEVKDFQKSARTQALELATADIKNKETDPSLQKWAKTDQEKNIANALAGIKFSTVTEKKDAAESIKQLLSENDTEGAKELLKSYVRNSASSSQIDILDGKENAIQALDRIESSLKTFQDNGGDTNIFTGLTEENLQKLGKTAGPELADIANQIGLAIIDYRHAVSGAAFTESEARAYEALFPSLGKESNLNQAKINSLRTKFQKDTENFYRQRIGTTKYDKIFLQGVNGATQSSVASPDSVWSKFIKIAPKAVEPQTPWDFVDTDTPDSILSQF